MQTMQYSPGAATLRAEAWPPRTSPFQLDLTEEQKRLCDWVAQQARPAGDGPTRLNAFGVPVRQIRYQEAIAALDLPEEQLTRMLRMMRERLDEIHEMVEAPVVNTQAPYFEVPAHAPYIWENYRRAEQSVESEPPVEMCTLELVQC
jgi:hypothetical protein